MAKFKAQQKLLAVKRYLGWKETGEHNKEHRSKQEYASAVDSKVSISC